MSRLNQARCHNVDDRSHLAYVIVFAVALAYAQSAFAAEQPEKTMQQLAADHGCHLCHSRQPPKPGSAEMLPIGPAWKDIAKKYKGQRDAAERLTAIVLHGSGLGPGDRHWQRKASGVAMLPNAVEINEADARKLVRWILSLAPSWSDPEGHR